MEDGAKKNTQGAETWGRDTRIVRAPRDPVKQVLARQMRRTMTPAEATLWGKLRNNQLVGLHFRRQQVIAGFIADFFCHAARLVVECDGSVHEGSEAYDQDRDAILSAHDLFILRFTNEEVETDLLSVLAKIAAAGTQRT